MFKFKFLILLVSILVLLSGLFFLQSKTEQTQLGVIESPMKPAPKPQGDNVAMCTQDAKLCPDGSYVGRTSPNCEFIECPKNQSSQLKGDQPNKSGLYLDVSNISIKNLEELDIFLKNEGADKYVLFFNASWCPFCRSANQAFLKNYKQIPDGVIVVSVDYDDSAEIKKKYGVNYQHTFVQVDVNGKQITKWIGGDIANLIKNLK